MRAHKTYREEFRPIIARVLRDHAGKPWREIAEELRHHFPLGERKYWPYKVWLSEIRRQRGMTKRRKHSIDLDQVDECPLFPSSATE